MQRTTRLLILATAIVWAGPLCAPQAKRDIARLAIAPEARVDINYASLDELLKISGMTRTWAVRIVRFRPYRTKQDLLEEGVVSAEVYARIKDSVIAHRQK